MTRYLFSYFTTQDDPLGEQVYFARNRGETPLRWEELNGGHPVLTRSTGRRGVRDPFLLRAAGLPGERAAFYLLATDMRAHGQDTAEFWENDQREGSRSIVIWESMDLVTWSSPRLVEVAPESAGNAWAPEAVFDPDTGTYLLFWASKLYPTVADRGASYNRMMAATTTDFQEFSPAFVWSDPGHSVIDSTVVRHEGFWFRFSKDERTPTSDTPQAKFITVDRSRRLASTEWEFVTDGVGSGGASGEGLVHGEGPIVVPGIEGGPWYLFIDEFGLRRYVPFLADGPGSATWTIADDFELPRGASHGSILPITEGEWARLAS